MNKEKVKKLKAKISDLESYNNEFKKLQEEFDENNSFIIERLEAIKKDIEILKDEVSIEALAEYKKTGSKTIGFGIKVKTMTKKIISYPMKTAFDWAKEKGLFLKLDENEFKKVAENLNLDFITVTKTENNIVTFPSKGLDI